MFLLKAYRAIRIALYNLKEEIKTVWLHHYKVDLGIQSKWSVFDKIKYNLLGFTNEDYHNYDLKHRDYHEFISYRERWRLEYINGRFAGILGEKLLFERIFGRFIKVPHIFCWVKKGAFIDMDTGKTVDLLSIAESRKTLIAKPTRGDGGGVGIHRIDAADGNCFIDGKAVSAEELVRTASSWEEYIIVDFIRQAPYAETIYPESTNSIRVVTAQRKNGAFEVLFAFHRFGSERSKPVDNFSSGGLFSLIDMESGQMSAAKQKITPQEWLSEHPDTCRRIEGITIPGWDGVKKKLLHVHQCFPYYTFLAWDVVIDQNGDPCVLEINRGSDLGIQMICPMRNKKLGEFMREYGLLDKR